METRTIKQKAFFRTTPHEVFELLMDSKKHTKLSGGKCTISRRVGGSISISDGYITGGNVELVPDKKIVQEWRAEEDCWPEDHFSIVTFELAAVEKDEGTWLSFTQTGVPVKCGDRFDSGWKEFYWEPMRALLEKKTSRK